jgi:hypothetical protein
MMHLNSFTFQQSNQIIIEDYHNTGTNGPDNDELDDKDLDILSIENLDVTFLDTGLDVQEKEKIISDNVIKSNGFTTANNNHDVDSDFSTRQHNMPSLPFTNNLRGMTIIHRDSAAEKEFLSYSIEKHNIKQLTRLREDCKRVLNCATYQLEQKISTGANFCYVKKEYDVGGRG